MSIFGFIFHFFPVIHRHNTKNLKLGSYLEGYRVLLPQAADYERVTFFLYF